MSFKELHDFESSMKNTFLSDMELNKSERIQRIVNYLGFDTKEVSRIVKIESTDFVIPYQGMLLGHPKFTYNVAGMRSALQLGFRKLSFICCRSLGGLTTEVVIFPTHLEEKYFIHFSKIDRLKAFL